MIDCTVQLAHPKMTAPPNPCADQRVPLWLLDRLEEVAPLVRDLRARSLTADTLDERLELSNKARDLEASLGASLLRCHDGDGE